MDKIITFFKSFSKIPEAIQKYGVQNIVITLILSGLLGLMIYTFANPEVILKKFSEAESNMQSEEFQKRMSVDADVRTSLIELKANLYADRVVVFEPHNGGSNLNGMKFIYLDMTYDVPSSHFVGVAREYINLRTSTNQWIEFIVNRGVWYGDIDDVKEIDIPFYYRLKQGGVDRVGIVVMEGKDRPTGILAVCYYDKAHGGSEYVPEKQDLLRELTKFGTRINAYLCNFDK